MSITPYVKGRSSAGVGGTDSSLLSVVVGMAICQYGGRGARPGPRGVLAWNWGGCQLAGM